MWREENDVEWVNTIKICCTFFITREKFERPTSLFTAIALQIRFDFAKMWWSIARQTHLTRRKILGSHNYFFFFARSFFPVFFSLVFFYDMTLKHKHEKKDCFTDWNQTTPELKKIDWN